MRFGCGKFEVFPKNCRKITFPRIRQQVSPVFLISRWYSIEKGREVGTMALPWRQQSRQQDREFRRISIRQIRKNPNQPRKVFDPQALQSLAESIRQYGVITPLTVREIPEGYEQNPVDQLIKNVDLKWCAENRDRILTEWTNRYDGKSEAK